MAGIKVDAHTHRPKYRESAWWSGERFRKNDAVTMIYYHVDNEKGSKAEHALKDIKEEKTTTVKKATAKAEDKAQPLQKTNKGSAHEDFSYAVSMAVCSTKPNF